MQIRLDQGDGEQEQHARREQGGDDGRGQAVRPEHQQAQGDAHEADVAVSGVQALDARVGHRLRAKPSAKVTAMPPPKASENPTCPTCSGVTFAIARNINAGSAR